MKKSCGDEKVTKLIEKRQESQVNIKQFYYIRRQLRSTSIR